MYGTGERGRLPGDAASGSVAGRAANTGAAHRGGRREAEVGPGAGQVPRVAAEVPARGEGPDRAWLRLLHAGLPEHATDIGGVGLEEEVAGQGHLSRWRRPARRRLPDAQREGAV